MIAAVAGLALAPVLIGAVAAPWAKRAVGQLRPALATVLLTALALTVAVATGLVLCLAGLVALLELSPMLGLDHWSPARLRHEIPIPTAFGVLVGGLGLILLASALQHLGRAAAQLGRTMRAAGRLPVCGADLVLLDDEDLIAYAVPGRPGRVVVSTGLLRHLDARQRRAVLAHEAAHLHHHHHIYVQLGRLAAAANPLVRALSAAIDLAAERWADDVAAAAVGDRGTVARAVAGVALARTGVPRGALAVAEVDVVTRVRNLLSPPRHRNLVAVLLLLGIAGGWATAGLVVAHIHALMELSEWPGR